MDTVMFAALKELFNEAIEKEKPVVGDDDDLKLGQKTRAYEKAKEIITKSFIEIKSYKLGEPEIKGFAKER